MQATDGPGACGAVDSGDGSATEPLLLHDSEGAHLFGRQIGYVVSAGIKPQIGALQTRESDAEGVHCQRNRRDRSVA